MKTKKKTSISKTYKKQQNTVNLKFEERKNTILRFVESDVYVPMKEKELAIVMSVSTEDRNLFKKALEELIAEGKLEVTKRGRYQKATAKVIVGTFISNAKGFGFVEVEGQDEDYFIPESKVNGAFHQDTVSIKLLPGQKGKRTEAEVVEIIMHGMTSVVGTFEKSANFGFVIPDNAKVAQDIFIPKEHCKGAVTGHKVVCEITSYGEHNKKPEGVITEIIGHANDPGVDILSIIRGFGLSVEFTDKQLEQAERVAKPVSEADCNGRKDLRDLMMVTIDGEDAKDLDDAVSLYIEDGYYHLGVHIADVANYVQETSALDREALKRGNSVYLVDRVIPMLPHTLSNGICSLNQKEDRLAMSCLMKINDKGVVEDYEIAETVICVNKRMNYTDVAKILEDHDEATIQDNLEFIDMFENMAQLSQILRQKRKERGSIDFDFQECKILLHEDGSVKEIVPRKSNTATRLIEDFMLMANETVASHFYWMEAPFVYRSHGAPDPEKISKLFAFINGFGYQTRNAHEDIHPKELQELLQKIAGSEEEALISRMLLRSMQQAKYTTDCQGHFGLAIKCYCHFTSPIRRYPDLQIHRIIKDQLRGRLTDDKIRHYQEILEGVCKQTSKTERTADEAERETEKVKKAQYMMEHIGEEFDGIISGVTSWGMYVELPDTVEGMVHISKIPGDYFIFDEPNYQIYGEKTGVVYRLGQPVRIKMKSVDPLTHAIDFALIAE